MCSLSLPMFYNYSLLNNYPYLPIRGADFSGQTFLFSVLSFWYLSSSIWALSNWSPWRLENTSETNEIWPISKIVKNLKAKQRIPKLEVFACCFSFEQLRATWKAPPNKNYWGTILMSSIQVSKFPDFRLVRPGSYSQLKWTLTFVTVLEKTKQALTGFDYIP